MRHGKNKKKRKKNRKKETNEKIKCESKKKT